MGCDFSELAVMDPNCVVDAHIPVQLAGHAPEDLLQRRPRCVSFASEHVPIQRRPEELGSHLLDEAITFKERTCS